MDPVEQSVDVAVEILGAPDRDALLGVALKRHDGSVSERLAQLRRDREPVLCVEGVIKGAAEGHRVRAGERRSNRAGRGGRNPSTPVRCGQGSTYPPLCNTNPSSCPTCIHFPTTTHAHTRRNARRTGAFAAVREGRPRLRSTSRWTRVRQRTASDGFVALSVSITIRQGRRSSRYEAVRPIRCSLEGACSVER